MKLLSNSKKALLTRGGYKVGCIFFYLLVSLYTHNGVADEISLNQQLVVCNKVIENSARLACFDEIAIQPNQIKDNFAKEHLKKSDVERANEIKKVTLTISDLSKNPYGKWIIYFENQQKWQQKDSNQLSLKVGQRVTLTKGALSAIYLQKENTTKRIKVKRLQ
ncbi:hypothetical protein [Colwellia sp. E2M01]|uniref:hypothetical protein n=1 Tax=Colwellia sp. E2M01 TaxID=2841561 RepID=UPI001C09082A|nr:hypothetical protein [Colwellia sp. E2M01]MBU2869559.1 hypothetical protein [Colwellia sp. E2M01]